MMHCYEFEPRGVIKLHGRGRAMTWFLTGRKADASVPLHPDNVRRGLSVREKPHDTRRSRH
jgi:hypothetical protein